MSKDNKSLQVESNREEREPEGNRIRSSDYTRLYANHAEVTFSSWDMRIIFGQILGQQENNLQIEEQAQIVMSLHHAKAFTEMLKSNLDEFERQFGEIRLIDLSKPQVTSEGQGEARGDQDSFSPAPIHRKIRVRREKQ